MPYLSMIIFLPLAGAIFLLFVPADNVKGIRTSALFFSGLALLVSLLAWAAYEPDSGSVVQLVEGKPYSSGVAEDPATEESDYRPGALDAGIPWIITESIKIYYFVGVDGISMPLVILTTLLSVAAVITSFNIEERVKEYFFFLLLLECGMLGVFCALDLFLFYIFWELVLVPMYFLVGIWGGPKKEYAAIKFFLYTLFGSVFMLLAIIALYIWSAPQTFNMLELKLQAGTFGSAFQYIVFLALFLAFAIKVPVFPFHTWLPLAHVEAPTAISIILAGVLLKMGIYGFLRVSIPILPEATAHLAFWFFIVLGFVNIVYGAFCAMAQTDMKRLVAYSSINHMGYCMLGLGSLSVIGLSGATFQMLGHGFVTGALFLLVGVIYDRAHHRDIDGFGGLFLQVPRYTGVMMLCCMASLGLPGLVGFWGEFLCFLGAFNSNTAVLAGGQTRVRIFIVCSVIGIIVTAAFFLWMIQRVFLGKLNPKYRDLPDMDVRETVAVAPLAVLTVLAGVYPWIFLEMINPATTALVKHVVEAVPK